MAILSFSKRSTRRWRTRRQLDKDLSGPQQPWPIYTKVNHYFSQEFIDYVAEVPDDGKGAYDRDRNPSLDSVVEVFDSTIEQEDYLMGETTQKSAETRIVKEFIFGRNEPALHHYHNTFREALDLPPLEKVGS